MQGHNLGNFFFFLQYKGSIPVHIQSASFAVKKEEPFFLLAVCLQGDTNRTKDQSSS